MAEQLELLLRAQLTGRLVPWCVDWQMPQLRCNRLDDLKRSTDIVGHVRYACPGSVRHKLRPRGTGVADRVLYRGVWGEALRVWKLARALHNFKRKPPQGVLSGKPQIGSWFQPEGSQPAALPLSPC